MRTSAQWPAVKGSIRQHAGSLCCRWMEDASPLKGGSRNRSGGLRLFRRFRDHEVHFDDAHTVFHLLGDNMLLANVLAAIVFDVRAAFEVGLTDVCMHARGRDLVMDMSWPPGVPPHRTEQRRSEERRVGEVWGRKGK